MHRSKINESWIISKERSLISWNSIGRRMQKRAQYVGGNHLQKIKLSSRKALTQKERQILYLIPTLWTLCRAQRNRFSLCESCHFAKGGCLQPWTMKAIYQLEDVWWTGDMVDNLAGKACVFYLNHNILLLPCWWMNATQMLRRLPQVTEGWNVLLPVDIQVN